MKTLYNDMEYLSFFIRCMLSDFGEINVGCLQRLAERTGYGDDMCACTYSQKYDDICPEGKVAIVDWDWDNPEEINTLVLYDPKFFYQHLAEACEKTAQKYPEDRKSMEQSLAKIRHDLNLD